MILAYKCLKIAIIILYNLAGNRVLSELERCQASVGAACHSHTGSKPSPILIACGVPEDIAINAMRLSVGRETTKEHIDTFIGDLTNAVKKLQQQWLIIAALMIKVVPVSIVGISLLFLLWLFFS